MLDNANSTNQGLLRGRLLRPAAITLLAFGAGLVAGRCHQPAPAEVTTVTVEDTESKERLRHAAEVERQLREQLSVARSQTEQRSSSTREQVRIIYRNDGTKVIDRTRSEDVGVSIVRREDSTQVRQEEVSVKSETTADSETRTKVVTTVKSSPKDSFYLGVSSSVGLTGLSRPGVEFKYRALDFSSASVWAGAEVLDPKDLQFRLSLGVSF